MIVKKKKCLPSENHDSSDCIWENKMKHFYCWDCKKYYCKQCGPKNKQYYSEWFVEEKNKFFNCNSCLHLCKTCCFENSHFLCAGYEDCNYDSDLLE